ncbi:MAG: outer membrane protein assembly factor BamA [Deferribacteraceae bacterium]|jgi:outer membrane protein insertion porin family|nr:outer membrane protein assembly factor BamA [Deferribacteraceae bacterium]
MLRTLIFTLLFTLFLAATVHAVTIDRVEISGNKRIVRERIANLLVRERTEFNPQALSDSIKKLHATGFFINISVDAGVRNNLFVITYIFQEVPLVAAIEFTGNENISADGMQEFLTFRVGEPLSYRKLFAAMKNIRDKYERDKYFSMDIDYTITYRNETSAVVTFNIKEGEISRVYNIYFYGNDNISTVELKDNMHTKEKDFWSKINSSGALVKDLMEYDRLLIQDLYMSKGFLHAEVGEPEAVFQSDKSRMNYLIRIKEGSQFSVKSVKANDVDKILKVDNLTSSISLKVGEPFNIRTYRKDIQELTKKYQDMGYAKVYIDAKIDDNAALKTVDVTYTAIPNSIYHINRIIFTGNTLSKDNVLRREFDIAEGELYNATLLEEAKRNLYSTGFYELVEITEEYDDAAAIADVVVNVREKKNRSINMQLAYSSMDLFMISLSFGYANLFGYGSTASVTGQWAEYVQSAKLNFSDPWFNDTPYSWGTNLEYTKREYEDEYDEHWVSLGFSVGHQPIKRRLYVRHGITHDEYLIEKVKSYVANYIKEKDGYRSILNTLSTSVTLEKLNNRLDPSDGYSLGGSVGYSGVFLGANEGLVEASIRAKFFKPLPYKFVFGVNYSMAQLWITPEDEDGRLPISKRYFLGGINSVRGFGWRDISPVDENGDPYGGNKMFLGNVELWRTLMDENMDIRGVVFFDIGQVYDVHEEFFDSKSSLSPKYSIGAGLRFYTPIGLMRLEYGYKLSKIQPGEDSSRGRLEFSVGSMF